jgi:hypothetical protein
MAAVADVPEGGTVVHHLGLTLSAAPTAVRHDDALPATRKRSDQGVAVEARGIPDPVI